MVLFRNILATAENTNSMVFCFYFFMATAINSCNRFHHRLLPLEKIFLSFFRFSPPVSLVDLWAYRFFLLRKLSGISRRWSSALTISCSRLLLSSCFFYLLRFSRSSFPIHFVVLTLIIKHTRFVNYTLRYSKNALFCDLIHSLWAILNKIKFYLYFSRGNITIPVSFQLIILCWHIFINNIHYINLSLELIKKYFDKRNRSVFNLTYWLLTIQKNTKIKWRLYYHFILYIIRFKKFHFIIKIQLCFT